MAESETETETGIKTETETEAAEQQRQSIARCMPFVPDQLNINERGYLMSMLYEFGIVSTYLTAVDNADNDGLGEDGLPVKFSNYFDFYDKGNGYIKIDPDTGRVTHLHLFKPIYFSMTRMKIIMITCMNTYLLTYRLP